MDENNKDLQKLNNYLNSEMINRSLQDTRVCIQCGRRLFRENKTDLCPMCTDQELFYKVKDYIRENEDVKDYDVAKKFNIPLSKVNDWIKQGRIQYKDDNSMRDVIMGNYCEICGTPTAIGKLCPRCLKMTRRQNIKGIATEIIIKKGNDGMKFLDEN